jgi:hypothetical protein
VAAGAGELIVMNPVSTVHSRIAGGGAARMAAFVTRSIGFAVQISDLTVHGFFKEMIARRSRPSTQ